MYIIIFGVLIIKLQISVSEPEFPPHIDLHKVGEAIFNNEKFNILKPTTHRVTDHFKDFMLRTESNSHPTKRVFIDNNGFRHDWSGFGEKTKSLRKTDLKHVSGTFENASKNTPQSEIISTDANDNTNATVKNTNDNNVSGNKDENNHQEVENNASDNNDTDINLTEEDTETLESKETTTTINLLPAIQKKNSSTENSIEKNLRQKKSDGKEDNKSKDGKPDEKKPNVRAERTVAQTTFFCPYFGTITMSAFID